jgi:aryl-alcohol dehydrogenase-like predicted oxidoreductase
MEIGHLVLGTAQFGLGYGVANTSGVPAAELVQEMVSKAVGRGVTFFDTAPAYGGSEQALGDAFSNLGIAGDVSVISKLGSVEAIAEPSGLRAEVARSLARLRIDRLWGLLLHREDDLDLWSGQFEASMSQLKTEGRIGHAGVSVYSCQRANQALATPGIDAIQVAANVFDRRMWQNGVFEQARVMGKSVFVRSIYLQGLVGMPPAAVPQHIPGARQAVADLDKFCATYSLDRRRFAIDHVRWMAPQAKIVIGAESVAQVVGNCDLIGENPIDDEIHREWTKRPSENRRLIDPRTWPVN